MIHQLKTKHMSFEDVVSGARTFEILRKDVDYKVDDFLALNELNDHMAKTNGEMEKETGRCCLVQVNYILDSPEYCKEGYVVLGIEACTIATRSGQNFLYDYRPRDVPVYGGESTC